jgi:dTMP kinase
MTPGRFIALEGGEGAGKSTQARLLGDALQRRGIDAVLTREPGGTPGAEGEGWNIRAEALLFAAARSDHVERLIRPALAAGRWVICDRFLDSSRAYQGAGGLDDAVLRSLHDIGSAGLLPNLTVLITVAAKVAATRLAARDMGYSDRIGGRPEAYHAQVTAAFAQDAEDEATHALVMQAIERFA